MVSQLKLLDDYLEAFFNAIIWTVSETESESIARHFDEWTSEASTEPGKPNIWSMTRRLEVPKEWNQGRHLYFSRHAKKINGCMWLTMICGTVANMFQGHRYNSDGNTTEGPS